MDKEEEGKKKRKNKEGCTPPSTFFTFEEGSISLRLEEKAHLLSSTGTKVWEASGLLSRYFISERKKINVSGNVIELGAGVGLCGLVLHHLGASSVLLTDLEPTQHLLHRNIQFNSDSSKGTIKNTELDWQSDIDSQKLKPPYNLIIGSEIIYKSELVPPLFSLMKKLSSSTTRIYLAFEPRCETVMQIFEEEAQKSFNMARVSPKRVAKEYQAPHIHIFKLWLK